MSKQIIAGGAVTGEAYETTVALTPDASHNVAVDASLGGVFTVTPDGSGNVTASNVTNGSRLVLVVNTSGTSSYTLTFTTNFKTTGTLATGTSDAKTFVLNFVGVGGKFVECSRTTAQ